MTNNGLEFEAKLFPRQKSGIQAISNAYQTYLCPLNCAREGNKTCLISLLLLGFEVLNIQKFSRFGCGSLQTMDIKDIVAEDVRRQNSPWSRTIFVQQPQPYTSTILRKRGQCTFRINFQPLLSCGFKLNKQVFADAQLGYWLLNTEDGFLVLKLCNSRARILFEELEGKEQVVALEVSCQDAPCFVLSVYRDTFVDPERTIATYLPNSGFSFEHSRGGGEEHCGSSERVLMMLKKKFPSRQYFDVELTIKDSKDEPLGKTQETNPVKRLLDRSQEEDT